MPSVLVLTWWYQLLVAATALVPLMLRYPSPPVVPGRRECMLLIVISSAQFVGQILLNRGFQLVSNVTTFRMFRKLGARRRIMWGKTQDARLYDGN